MAVDRYKVIVEEKNGVDIDATELGLDGVNIYVNPSVTGLTADDVQSSLAELASGSSIKKTTATIDFGAATIHENDTASVVVSASWVTSSMRLIASFTGPNSDHDVDDATIEQMSLSVGNIVDGVSFEVVAHAPNSTWGQYSINVIGV